MIYLDYNASAPLHKGVIEAMVDVSTSPGNPSSVHQFGRTCRQSIEVARKILADSLRVSPAQIIFTSGGTESNNQVMQLFKILPCVKLFLCNTLNNCL